MKQDLPDEIEPSIPNSEELKRLMEQYKERDREEAPSALWFFCGIAAIILILMVAIVMSSCQTIILDSDCDLLHKQENQRAIHEEKPMTHLRKDA